MVATKSIHISFNLQGHIQKLKSFCHPKEAALPTVVLQKSNLDELLSNGDIALVHRAWLHASFVCQKVKLVRRQELPEEALVPSACASICVKSAEETRTTSAIISHAWLSPSHPDPVSRRCRDVGCVTSYLEYTSIFWDFLSLYQWPRSDEQEASFRKALEGLQFVYSNPLWPVFRILTLPRNSLNSTPYWARGWCVFETHMGSVGALTLISVREGRLLFDEKSPVPLLPAQFDDELWKVHFSNSRTDPNFVCALYRQNFQRMVQKENLLFFGWGDQEVRDLLVVLPSLVGAKSLKIDNAIATETVSEELRSELGVVLAARGGSLTYEPPRDKAYENGWSAEIEF